MQSRSRKSFRKSRLSSRPFFCQARAFENQKQSKKEQWYTKVTLFYCRLNFSSFNCTTTKSNAGRNNIVYIKWDKKEAKACTYLQSTLSCIQKCALLSLLHTHAHTHTHTHSLSISSHSSADPVTLSQQEVISFSLAFYVSSLCLLPIAVLSMSFVF